MSLEWFHIHDNTPRALPMLFPPLLPSKTCFVLACRGFWNTRVIRGCGTCRKSKLLRHGFARPGPWRIFAFFGSPRRKRTLFLVGSVDSRDLRRVARTCAGTGGRYSVSRQNKKFIHMASASRSKSSSSPDHTRALRLSFALATILSMNARRFQRTLISFEWNGIFTQRVKRY